MLSDDGPIPGLYPLPLDDSFFSPKRIPLPPLFRVRVGRQLNQKSAHQEIPDSLNVDNYAQLVIICQLSKIIADSAANGVFESRVLSRQHTEAWVENGWVLIRDVKSLNGTFGNGERLSLEGLESDLYELRSDGVPLLLPKFYLAFRLAFASPLLWLLSKLLGSSITVGVAHTVRMSRLPSEFYVVCARIALAPVTGRTG
ncbi:hypothetical protein DFH08DRAFT_1090259 [Mycena albidolilacea]|uniref:FHA domain-containing protein n=1 Tax=Mycena albidolilacea TaxID=1033008 RepID=A0AAD7E744_9AGAR|nr:hypothetical protein DFH08DRAFT_1090259 [Mycena albidolilacea]